MKRAMAQNQNTGMACYVTLGDNVTSLDPSFHLCNIREWDHMTSGFTFGLYVFPWGTPAATEQPLSTQV